MTPIPKNDAKKPPQGVSKIVRFTKRDRKPDSPIPGKSNESLILYYLTKLKKLFKSQENKAGRGRSSVRIGKPQDGLTTGIAGGLDKSGDIDNRQIQDVMYNVVNEALEYGFRNKILEKRGNCFMLTGTRSVSRRDPTPGPQGFRTCNCRRCSYYASCSNRPGGCQECARIQREKQARLGRHPPNNFMGKSSSFTNARLRSRSRLGFRCNCSKCRIRQGKII
ncbi:unnamed protein product [Psylliodes chrysocephalus]|uniref:Uncharacterized protein n=1 Tax=Psylliodes chrysocephalus TaxID=3402493 RepID=A0A9P0G7Y9_9CUCU|nr:unnamed protein product [Psylliodes chrysocephala]